MQDVPQNQAYVSLQDFLMRYCGCYEEYPNSNYKPMVAPWEAGIQLDEMTNYMKKYDQWQRSEESQSTFRKFASEKVTKPIEELIKEYAMIFEDDRVYLSVFHYNKHLNYVNYMYQKEIGDNVKK